MVGICINPYDRLDSINSAIYPVLFDTKILLESSNYLEIPEIRQRLPEYIHKPMIDLMNAISTEKDDNKATNWKVFARLWNMGDGQKK